MNYRWVRQGSAAMLVLALAVGSSTAQTTRPKRPPTQRPVERADEDAPKVLVRSLAAERGVSAVAIGDTGSLMLVFNQWERSGSLHFYASADDVVPGKRAEGFAPIADASAAVYKRLAGGPGAFVVGRAKSGVIELFDDAGKPLGKVDTGCVGIAGLAAPVSRDVPYVIYTGTTSPQPNQVVPVIGAIDVSGPAPRHIGTFDVASENRYSNDFTEVPRLSISDDGRYLYAASRSSSPTGFRVAELVGLTTAPPSASDRKPAQLTAEILRSEHESVTELVVDPGGRFLATRNRLYPARTTRSAEPTSLRAGRAVASFREAAVLVVDDGANLIALNWNDRSEIGRMAHPLVASQLQFVDSRSNGRFVPTQPENDTATYRLFIDEKSLTGLIVTAREPWLAHSFSLKPMLGDKPLPPTVAARVPGGVPAGAPGVAWKATLRAMSPATKFTLASAPEGMRLDGNGIATWTPATSQVGKQAVTLKLTDPSLAQPVEQSFSIDVRRPSVRVDFDPTFATLSPDGARLVLASRIDPNRGGGDRSDSRLAVVDVASMTTIASAPLAHSAGDVALDDRNVYLALSDADAIVVLSASDLTEKKRIFTQGKPFQIAVAGGKVIAVLQSQNGGDVRYAAFDAQTLEPVDFVPSGDGLRNMMFRGYNQRAGLPLRTRAASWSWLGALYDDALTRPIELGRPVMPIEIATGQPDRQDSSQELGRGPFGAWSVDLRGGGLVRQGGQSVGVLSRDVSSGGFDSTGDVAFAAPVVLSLSSMSEAEERAPGAPTAILKVIASDLDGLKPVAEFPLRAGRVNREQNSGGYRSDRQAGNRVIATPRGAVVLVGREVYSIDGAELKPLAPPAPFTLDNLDPKIVVSLDSTEGDEQLRFAAAGGKPPYVYELVSTCEGASIDGKTGVVKLNRATLAGTLRKTMEENARNAIRMELNERLRDRNQAAARTGGAMQPSTRPAGAALAEQVVRKAIDQQSTFTTSVPGLKVDGIGASLRVHMRVRDADQRVVEAQCYLVIALPTDRAVAIYKPIVEAIEREHGQMLEQQRRAQDEYRRAAEQQQRAASQPANGANAAEIAELRRRLADLERENARLRGQVEILTELVKGQRGDGASSAESTTQPTR